jgi:hypothetical protein
VAAEAAARDPGSVSAAVVRVFPEAAGAEVQAAQAVPGAADPVELVLVVPAVEVASESMPVICGVRRDKLEVVVAAVVEAEEEAALVLAGAAEAVLVEAVEQVEAEEAEPVLVEVVELVLEVAAVLQATLVAFPAREARRERRLENG